MEIAHRSLETVVIVVPAKPVANAVVLTINPRQRRCVGVLLRDGDDMHRLDATMAMALLRSLLQSQRAVVDTFPCRGGVVLTVKGVEPSLEKNLAHTLRIHERSDAV